MNNETLSDYESTSANNDHTVQQQDKNDNDVYKSSGKIVFCMNNFKAFSEGNEAKEVLSEPVVYINGLPWRILVKRDKDSPSFGLFLCCFGDETDMAWHCVANKHLSIVSCTKKGQQKTQTKERTAAVHFDIFDPMTPRWGEDNFANFAEVMDDKNGQYNAAYDTVTFLAEVYTEPPKGMPGLRPVHPLRVNGNLVHVNKFMLAAHSDTFRKLFFGKEVNETPNVNIDHFEGDVVPFFERLIATMYPTNAELDDDCVEEVLQLATIFQLDVVENRCAKFLLTKSKKSAICKFRLAHQSGITGMKKKVLQEMNKTDFEVTGPKFMETFLDYNKLDQRAVKELGERHKALFGTGTAQ